MVVKKEVVKEVNPKEYFYSSDGEKFDREDKANLHEGFLEYERKIEELNIPNIENAYFCKTEEEFRIVKERFSHLYGGFVYNRGYIPIDHYEGAKFAGPDWYFFEYEYECNYPDEYWVETMTQKEKEFMDWKRQFEFAHLAALA